MLIFDLESDGFLEHVSVIHCIHMVDSETGERWSYNQGRYADGSPAPRDGSLEEGIKRLEEAPAIAGHNIIAYDIPVILKLFPETKLAEQIWEPGKLFDTLITSRIIWSNLMDIDKAAMRKGKRPEGFKKYIGAHKLEAWGYRLGVLKSEYDGEWHSFTPEMDSYGAQDPMTTLALYEKIMSKGYSPEALELEFKVAMIIFMQQQLGFKFDSEQAEELQIILQKRKAELADELRAAFPPWYEPVRKHGKPVEFIPKRDNARHGYMAGVPSTKVKLISFNPGSRQQIANRMITLFDWHPVEFTESGQPKVDETTLEGLDYPEAKLLTEYLTVDKRLGALAEGKQAWLKAVKDDGRIHGRVNSVGAVTRRMTHSTPNVAQVPASHAPYGAQCRALFTTVSHLVLVGCDAEGLELRMLAHYMAKHDGGDYVETVINGNKADGTDVHTVNQKIVGLNSRDSGKTFIYAYLYGAGDPKLGSIVYDDYTESQREGFNRKNPAGPKREQALRRLGRKARSKIEGGLPALGQLQEKVKRLSKKGYLKTLDKGALKVRSQHAALNTLLQGGGAVLMKKSLVMLVDELMSGEGFVPDYLAGTFTDANDNHVGFVANVHDEFQMEVSPDYAERLMELSRDSIRLAGVAFELRCPTAGAADLGQTWKDTH